MTAGEKNFCDMILNESKEVKHETYITQDGTVIDFYNTIFCGCKFTMTKHDGEWVYIHRDTE